MCIGENMYQVMVLVLVFLVGCSEQLPESYQPLPKVSAISEFSLYDQNAQTISNNELKGHWTLLFFGYTFCPDVCPTTLAELNKVAAKVENDDFQVVLVSVDPERDSPKQLKDYINYFNPKFQAWSGEVSQIESLARQLHIFFQKQPFEDSYLMDHSSQVVLINPKGEYVGFFTAPLSTADMVSYINAQG
jgi:protein SCO1/2